MTARRPQSGPMTIRRSGACDVFHGTKQDLIAAGIGLHDGMFPGDPGRPRLVCAYDRSENMRPQRGANYKFAVAIHIKSLSGKVSVIQGRGRQNARPDPKACP